MKLFLTLSLLCLLSMNSLFASVIPGVKGPYLNFIDGKIHVGVTFTKLEIDKGIDIVVPKLPQSSMHVTANELDGGTLVTLKLAQEDLKIIKTVVLDRAFYLPDGRAIPRIPGGGLKNSLRLDLKPVHKKLSFYYHESLFGFYVPLNLKYANFPVNGADISLKWKGKNVGFVAFIGPEGEKPAALLVFLRLKDIEGNPEIMERLVKKNL